MVMPSRGGRRYAYEYTLPCRRETNGIRSHWTSRLPFIPNGIGLPEQTKTPESMSFGTESEGWSGRGQIEVLSPQSHSEKRVVIQHIWPIDMTWILATNEHSSWFAEIEP